MVHQSAKTLAQLTGVEITLDYPSGLVQAVHRAWYKPLRNLEPADVRVVIGQGWDDCLPYLAPIAIEMLEADPLTCASFYDGDLLSALLAPALDDFWQHPKHRAQQTRVRCIAERARATLTPNRATPAVSAAIERFLTSYSG